MRPSCCSDDNRAVESWLAGVKRRNGYLRHACLGGDRGVDQFLGEVNFGI